MTSIYIHIPFCLRKCHYCDFFSISHSEEAEKRYIDALCNSIREKSYFSDEIKTLYFGGGTPSVLSEDSIEKIFKSLEKYNISSCAEITLEANPATCDIDKLKFFRNYFNRISIGVQSFNNKELKTLGRLHNSIEAQNCVLDAHKAGFHNISLDLMYAIPFQNEVTFRESVETGVSLPIKHISAYELSIEEHTVFGNNSQILDYIDEEIDYDVILKSILEKNGFFKYEVSNYAKDGFESKHNINYWNNNEYLGFGAGAVGYINGERYKYVSDLPKYIENNLIEYSEKLNHKDKAFENLMLGLRMAHGFNIHNVLKYLSESEKNVFLEKIYSMEDYVILKDNVLCPTEIGMNYLNSIILELDTFRN